MTERRSTLLCLLLPALGVAEVDSNPDTTSNEDAIEELVVYGRARSLIGSARSASEGLVGYDDIALPPLLRVGELVEAVPGMVATQHSGTGKANQFFMRGFNLDHGTDFAASVEGVPINLRSHGHGQGYLDLNFLIPELVETIRYRRGPYYARIGDFSSAGSVDFDLYDRLPESLVAATVGADGYYRTLAAGSTQVSSGTLIGALDVMTYAGPWDLEENLEQYKFHGAWTRTADGVHAKATLQLYEGSWDATDQIPSRAVASGQVNRLGYIDPDLGGQTHRYALTGELDTGSWKFNAFALDYDLSLYSNFTYFLERPVAGDEFEQRDSRRVFGASARNEQRLSLGNRAALIEYGGEVRYDDIDEVGLFATAARVRQEVHRRDSVEELSLGAWAEAGVQVNERLRSTLGLRADFYRWQVDAWRAANSGRGNDSILSPKATLAYRMGEGIEGYLSWGRGFHSNDVRGATIELDPLSGEPVQSVDVLVRSNGAEAGLRFEQGNSFNASLAVFWLELDSELVYVGDAGTTEPNGATERVGIEAGIFWQARDWLAVNAAYARTDAAYRVSQGGGTRIPGAVESTFTLGVNAAWANGLRASTRLRWLGKAPLVEDGSVYSDGSLLLNFGIAYESSKIEYRVDVFNLLDSDDHDISYYYASRLPGEPAAGIEDVHFHPLEPRSVRASVTLRWK